MLEIKDPKRLLDRAVAEGYVAIEFQNTTDAQKYAKRVRRILTIGAQKVEEARIKGTDVPTQYVGADAWEPLYVNQQAETVEVINIEHPVGQARLPKFKVKGAV